MYKSDDISSSFETWMSWLGIPKHRIQQVKLEILSKKLNGESSQNTLTAVTIPQSFPEISLPEHAMPLNQWVSQGIIDENFQQCQDYLHSRGTAVSTGYTYYWSNSHKHDMNKRIIIPFKHENKIVGWTARFAGKNPKNIPRYFNSNLPGNYLFNAAAMSKHNRKFILIVEGPFDAIAIDAVGVLGSTLNKSQIAWINAHDKEIIVLPDRESKNQDLIDIAVDQGWSVSFPQWERNIKDAADASKRYGKLFTLASAISSRTSNKLQIELNRRMMKG